MDYLFIFLLQSIGFFSFQYPALKVIDAKYANDTFNDVLKAFWEQDKITVLGSIGILSFQFVFHAAVDYYELPIKNEVFDLGFWPHRVTYTGAFLSMALILGFGGQALLYGILGKAGDFIKNKFGTK